MKLLLDIECMLLYDNVSDDKKMHNLNCIGSGSDAKYSVCV